MYTRRRAYAQQKTKLQPLQKKAAKRLSELSRLFWHYHFPDGSRLLPDNDFGVRCARYYCRTTALLPNDRREDWLDRHAPWLVGRAERSRILRLGSYWYSGISLGQHLDVDDEVRTRLKLWSVLPNDLTHEEFKQRQKERHAMREQARRRARGAKPHAESKSRTMPWLAAGFRCRRTWERHGMPAAMGVANSCETLLILDKAKARICDTPSKEATKSSANDNVTSQTSIQSSSRGSNTIEDKGGLGEFGHASLPNAFWRPINGLPRLPGYIVRLPIPALKEAA